MYFIASNDIGNLLTWFGIYDKRFGLLPAAYPSGDQTYGNAYLQRRDSAWDLPSRKLRLCASLSTSERIALKPRSKERSRKLIEIRTFSEVAGKKRILSRSSLKELEVILTILLHGEPPEIVRV